MSRWVSYKVRVGRPLSTFEVQYILGIPGVRSDYKDPAGTYLVPLNAGWLVGGYLTQFQIPHRVDTVSVAPPWAGMKLDDAASLRPERRAQFGEFQREGFELALRNGAILAKWGMGAGKTWLGAACAVAPPGNVRAVIVTGASVREQWVGELLRLSTVPEEKILALYGESPFVIEARKKPHSETYWLAPEVQTVLDWFRFAMGDTAAAGRCADGWPRLRAEFREGVREPGGLQKLYQRWIETHQSGKIKPNPLWDFLNLHLELTRSSGEVPLATAAEQIRERLSLAVNSVSWGRFIQGMNGAPVSALSAYLGWFDTLAPEPWQVRHGVTRHTMGRYPTREAAQAAVDLHEFMGPMGLAQSLLGQYQIVVVNWDILPAWARIIAAWGPTVTVLDEIHRSQENKGRWIWNEPTVDPVTGVVAEGSKGRFVAGTNQSAGAMIVSIPATMVIGLSGTPMSLGAPRDLYAPTDNLLPKQFGNYKAFTSRYCEGYEGKYAWEAKGASNIPELQQRLSFVLHSVPKSVSHAGLPPTRFMSIKIPAKELAQVRTSRGERADAYSRGPSAVRELLLAQCAHMKNPWIVKRVTELLSVGPERILIFQGRVAAVESLGAGLEKSLRKQDFKGPIWAISGDESSKAGIKGSIIREFVRAKEGAVLVCMLQAWGESINGLQYTDRCIYGMLPGTVRQALQSAGRVDRKPDNDFLDLELPSSLIEWPIALGTIEEAINELLLNRLDTTDAILDDDQSEQMAHNVRGGRTIEMILNEMALAQMSPEEEDRWANFKDDDD